MPTNSISISVLFVLCGMAVTTQGLQCYDCNNGAPNRPFVHCPTNGLVNGKYASSVPCKGLCYSKTHKVQPGRIYRGCSAYFPNLPAGIEPFCYSYQGDIWCFCDNNNCNRHDMEADAGK